MADHKLYPERLGCISFSPYLYCACHCHSLTWMGTKPPVCTCSCSDKVITFTQNSIPEIPRMPSVDKLDSTIEIIKDYLTPIVHTLSERIRILEALLNDLKSAKSPLNSGKKPFKCPICDGSAGVRHPLTGLMQPATCHACEGKGIVWG